MLWNSNKLSFVFVAKTDTTIERIVGDGDSER